MYVAMRLILLLCQSKIRQLRSVSKGGIVIEQIKSAIHNAAGNNEKIAMFHFQVLKNADELAGIDPIGFCWLCFGCDPLERWQ